MSDNNRLNRYLETLFSQAKWKGQEAALPLFQKWREIVGDLAVHCNLADLDHGVMLVQSDHPGWIQLFQFKEKELLGRFQKKFPSLKIRAFRYKILTPEFSETQEPITPLELQESQNSEEKIQFDENDPILLDILKKLEP